MSYEVRFLPEAQKDFSQLDGSQKQQAAKAIQKVSQNPLPYTEDGYGKSLGNHRETILVGLLKIKLRVRFSTWRKFVRSALSIAAR